MTSSSRGAGVGWGWAVARPSQPHPPPFASGAHPGSTCGRHAESQKVPGQTAARRVTGGRHWRVCRMPILHARPSAACLQPPLSVLEGSGKPAGAASTPRWLGSLGSACSLHRRVLGVIGMMGSRGGLSLGSLTGAHHAHAACCDCRPCNWPHRGLQIARAPDRSSGEGRHSCTAR